jgi:tetratricopeptide (TPR) repeat protein
MFRDKKNLSFGRLFIAMMLMIIAMLPAEGQNAIQKKTDSQQLGFAITYFQGGKYHEAKLILQRLDKKYQLNPRFRAYLGVCYYYDQEYEQATNCLDSVIPQLQAFDPQELSFYYYADGESYFTLGKYEQATPLYDQSQARCHEDEKAKIYYRLGLCYSFLQQWYKALDALQSALVYYQQYRPQEKAKIAEIRNLIFACCAEINKPTS